MKTRSTLPDVAENQPNNRLYTLQWVGMEKIAVPVILTDNLGQAQTLVGESDIYVSLDKREAKGIHMSRLHRIINTLAEASCSKETFDQLLDDMISSQQGLSEGAKIRLRFNKFINKKALLSDESGFQSYDVVITGEVIGHIRQYSLDVTIPYSSTCPCSAALSRQLYADAIDKVFTESTIDKGALLDWAQSESGTVATPHSQRSYATLKLALGDNEWPDLGRFIAQVEEALGTAVQTAVRRVDEQEFASRNAQNLMFCEDAARKVKEALEGMTFIENYWLKVDHQESLHAHNAVAIDQKHRDAPTVF